MENLNAKIKPGFTLLELLIAIAIFATLSMIAVASYQSYMIKTRRTSAYVLLQQMMNFAQQYFVQNNFSYPASLSVLYGGAASVPTSPYYTFSSVACSNASCTAPCFQIEANATVGTAQANDTGCTKLDLDSCGNKMPTTGNCWNTQ